MRNPRFLLFTSILLGLAWAVRGHFGHEWGAAWAGAIGGMALVAASLREDWIVQLPYLSALTALGWGVGGMMSYGIVIGYCRGDDFANVLYGYSMLFVIGGLYGCIGGGFLGLGLETTDEKQPSWSTLIAEMVAGAILIWGIVIYQLEWFMTPPRSELWAACLGAALAMIWYMVRNGFHKALYVSLWTMSGAGVGFFIGNFIQNLGHASGFQYNWWNVMEFTLGLSGGLSMAYAVSTTQWKKTTAPPKLANWISLIFIFIILPFTNYTSSFTQEKLTTLGEQLDVDNLPSFISAYASTGIIFLVIAASIGIWFWHRKVQDFRHKYSVIWMPIILCTSYVILSMILKGYFTQPPSLGNSVSTYIPLLLVSLYIGKRITDPLANVENWTSQKRIYQLITTLLITLLATTLISIFINDPPTNLHERF